MKQLLQEMKTFSLMDTLSLANLYSLFLNVSQWETVHDFSSDGTRSNFYPNNSGNDGEVSLQSRQKRLKSIPNLKIGESYSHDTQKKKEKSPISSYMATCRYWDVVLFSLQDGQVEESKFVLPWKWTEENLSWQRIDCQCCRCTLQWSCLQ